MKKDVNKTLIGAFVVGAVGLMVAGVLALGGGSLLAPSESYVLYFPGSVKGLGLGAPVQLKGVTLGKVTAINLVYDPANESFLNRVAFEINEGAIKVAGGPETMQSINNRSTLTQTVDDLVEDGLRAKLKIQSVVTGQLLVAFDFYPDSPIHRVGVEDELHELPTLPSDMEELERTLADLDIKGLADSFKNVARGVDELVNSPDMQSLAATASRTLTGYHRLATRLETEVASTLSEARRLIRTADDQITPMARGITGTAGDLRETIARLNQRLPPAVASIEAAAASAASAFRQADKALSNLADLSGENSTLIYRIDETLAETQKAARALTLLVDYLNRHPEALLRGKTQEKGAK